MLSRFPSLAFLPRLVSRRSPSASVVVTASHCHLSRTFSSASSSHVAAVAAPPFILRKEDKLTVYARVTEQAEKGKYVHEAVVRGGKHTMLLDDRGLHGGFDVGPSPYDLLVTALGACTSMTLRIYAQRKTQSMSVPRISVEVAHSKKNATDIAEAPAELKGPLDLFEVTLSVAPTDPTEPALSPETKALLLEIAGKCPVHKTLAGNPKTFVRTKWE